MHMGGSWEKLVCRGLDPSGFGQSVINSLFSYLLRERSPYRYFVFRSTIPCWKQLWIYDPQYGTEVKKRKDPKNSAKTDDYFLQCLWCYLERKTGWPMLELWNWRNHRSCTSSNQNSFLSRHRRPVDDLTPDDHRLFLSHPFNSTVADSPPVKSATLESKMCHMSQYTIQRLKPNNS